MDPDQAMADINSALGDLLVALYGCDSPAMKEASDLLSERVDAFVQWRDNGGFAPSGWGLEP